MFPVRLLMMRKRGRVLIQATLQRAGQIQVRPTVLAVPSWEPFSGHPYSSLVSSSPRRWEESGALRVLEVISGAPSTCLG